MWLRFQGWDGAPFARQSMGKFYIWRVPRASIKLAETADL
jgi:hypothetical protein